MFSQKEILRVAMEQSARDLNCRPEDFLRSEPVIVSGGLGPDAKRYYTKPVSCLLVSYGMNAVASVREECREAVTEYVNGGDFYRCFEATRMLELYRRLDPRDCQTFFQAEYFLPRLDRLRAPECPYPLRVIEKAGFAGLYQPEWHNALCEERKELDVLGVGAYDGDRLIALAGCSADAEEMWQIGIDVLPAYRRRGVAAALTGRLALEILDRGKVPFYCAAWSNLPSVRNALKCGFAPAWVEMSVKAASPTGN